VVVVNYNNKEFVSQTAKRYALVLQFSSRNCLVLLVGYITLTYMIDAAYSFRDGLTIDRTVYQTPDSIVSESLHLEEEVFRPEPLEPDQKPLFDTFYAGHRQLSARTTLRRSGKLAIQALAWGGTAENPATAHETQRFDEVFSDYDTLHLTMPGHGQQHPSSRWPADVRLQMHTSGSFLRAGRHLATFLRNSDQVFDADTIDVIGVSTGGRSSIGLASELGRQVSNLVIFDAPGSEKMSYGQFKECFTVVENQYGRRYSGVSEDVQYQDIMSALPSRASREYLQDFARRDVRAAYDFYISEVYGMAKGSLERDMLRAPLENVGRVVFISPTESALNKPGAVDDILRNAKLQHPTTQFEQYVFTGTHLMPRTSSAALAWLTKAAITPQNFRS